MGVGVSSASVYVTLIIFQGYEKYFGTWRKGFAKVGSLVCFSSGGYNISNINTQQVPFP